MGRRSGTRPPAARSAPRRAAGESRARLFAAAATEFAARGFAGASVDRIADAAGVNKAMLYYHFDSKAGLYSEILRDMFGAVASRVETATAPGADPADHIRAMVEAIAREAEARPHFPAIWLREIAEGGPHVDQGTFQVIAGILQRLASVVEAGVTAGRFRPVNPLLVQFGIVGPLLMFLATAPIRQKARVRLPLSPTHTIDEVIAHVQRVALLTLEGSAS
jgi:AcrR family transcriptional regulator